MQTVNSKKITVYHEVVTAEMKLRLLFIGCITGTVVYIAVHQCIFCHNVATLGVVDKMRLVRPDGSRTIKVQLYDITRKKICTLLEKKEGKKDINVKDRIRDRVTVVKISVRARVWVWFGFRLAKEHE